MSFSIIQVTLRKENGTINGDWIQDFYGSFSEAEAREARACTSVEENRT